MELEEEKELIVFDVIASLNKTIYLKSEASAVIEEKFDSNMIATAYLNNFWVAGYIKYESEPTTIKFPDGSHSQDMQGVSYTTTPLGHIKHKQLKSIQENEWFERKQLQTNIDANESVSATNKSIQDLNEKTGIFYSKQNGYNKWQKYLTITIAAFTLVSTTVATCTLISDENNYKSQKKSIELIDTALQSIARKIQFQKSQDSILFERLKDSLRIP